MEQPLDLTFPVQLFTLILVISIISFIVNFYRNSKKRKQEEETNEKLDRIIELLENKEKYSGKTNL